MTILYPAPLATGDRIAVVAPSSGVEPPLQPRLDAVLAHHRELGFVMEEGRSLRSQYKDASAPAMERAEELMAALTDPGVAAVIPPWGGELAIELLPLLDFDLLARSKPKWLLGFSDTSTLLLPLTVLTGWATAHGACLMQMGPGETEPLTAATLDRLRLPVGSAFTQASSLRHRRGHSDWVEQPRQAFQLTEASECRVLGGAAEAEASGRLIGGCLDTVTFLAGSRYGDVPGFLERHRDDGVLLYLENCEQTPCTVARMLTGLRMQGWFDGVKGVLLGRNSGPDAEEENRLGYADAVASALRGLDCPVLLDLDIGHSPPQWLLLNAARATVRVRGGRAEIRQTLD